MGRARTIFYVAHRGECVPTWADRSQVADRFKHLTSGGGGRGGRVPYEDSPYWVRELLI